MELLTVIAIIAVLAAIIFPVFNSVRRSAKQTQCSSNMEQIFQALKLYHQDYQAYPPLLFGFVERYASGNAVVPIDKASNATLYRDKLSTVQSFHCPFNTQEGEKFDNVVKAVYPRVQVKNGTNWANANGIAGDVVQRSNGTSTVDAEFYAYDSYDIGKINSWKDGAPVYELHYMLFWTTDGMLQGGQNDDLRQIGYRHPSEDAVVTWCTYARSWGPQGSKEPSNDKNDNVLFLNGQVKPVDSRNMAARGFGQSQNER